MLATGETCLDTRKGKFGTVGETLNDERPDKALGPVGGRRAEPAHDVSTPFPFGPEGGRRAFMAMLPLLLVCGTWPFTIAVCFPWGNTVPEGG